MRAEMLVTQQQQPRLSRQVRLRLKMGRRSEFSQVGSYREERHEFGVIVICVEA